MGPISATSMVHRGLGHAPASPVPPTSGQRTPPVLELVLPRPPFHPLTQWVPIQGRSWSYKSKVNLPGSVDP